MTCVQDVFTLIPAAEIRALREESPSNLATLCYKAVEKLVQAADNGCGTTREQQTGGCTSFIIDATACHFGEDIWKFLSEYCCILIKISCSFDCTSTLVEVLTHCPLGDLAVISKI